MIKIVMLCKLLLMVVLQEKQWHTRCIAQIKFLSIPLKINSARQIFDGVVTVMSRMLYSIVVGK